jgi:hypothetical protein
MDTFRDSATGAQRLYTPKGWLLLVSIAALAFMAIRLMGLSGAVALVVLPIGGAYLYWIFRSPRVAIYTIVAMSFAISGLGRYYPVLPFGLSIDFLIVLAFVSFFFQHFKKVEWAIIPFDTFAVVGIWFVYCVAMVANPLSPGAEAWFYASRGLAFYMFFMIPVAILTFNRPRDMERFLIVWLTLSSIGSLWAAKQIYLGVSNTEQQWLDGGAASTHLLFGKLRAFAYYSDAGQFGAAQAHAAVVSLVVLLYPTNLRKRLLYLTFFLLNIWGMMLSGTRGAIFLLGIAVFVYLFFSKRFTVLILGGMLAVGAFGFLKYTTLLNSNYQINRMRTAFDPNDPSLMVRKNREKVLKVYLANKPIGEGIGSAGYWGQRFRPGSFLADLGTDSHFVRVWAETGIVGLLLNAGMFLYLLVRCGTIIWRMEQSYQRNSLVALYSGFAGVTVASYGNNVIAQMPTGTLIYLSIAFILASRRWASQTVADMPQQQ